MFARFLRTIRASRPLSRTPAGSRTCRPRLEVLEDRRLMARDSILEWNAVMLQANANDHALAAPEQGGPVLTGRAFAIVSGAMYDAYNSVKRVGDQYLVTAPLTGRTDEDAAVAQAAHDTLVALFPSQQTFFDRALKFSLLLTPNGAPETRGREVGRFVAQQILDARADDGTAEMMNPQYDPSHLPGFHDADPLHPLQGFYASGAANIDPFALPNLEDFKARDLDDGTPAGREAFMQTEEYEAAFEEVKRLGGDGVSTPTDRTRAQSTIGVYWGYDGRPGLGTPPRLYNQIARTISLQRRSGEGQNARLFALLNIAMADAGLASWTTKYSQAIWRPVMGVRGGEVDGSPETIGDDNWQPLGAPASNPRPGETNFTPPFPAYTSGHATLGAAAFQTLRRFYGTDRIRFTFISDEFNGRTRDASGRVRPLVVRTFQNLSQAEFENAQSRIYLGIHWAFDRDEGIIQGNNVADFIFDNSLEPNRPRGGGGQTANSSAAMTDIALMSLLDNPTSGRRRGG
jgi:hypothetical protein